MRRIHTNHTLYHLEYEYAIFFTWTEYVLLRISQNKMVGDCVGGDLINY